MRDGYHCILYFAFVLSMDLSIIIVNYNVKYFVEQCLRSVLKASEGLETEIILVDNHSTEGSLPYLRGLFPGVHFIANDQNRGFGAANNQGAREARGKYLLLLNPDTVIPEDCFHKCIGFMDGHPDAGALGVRMVDGSGKFLPESKRSFPSPLVSFYKISGLSNLFPNSKIFARYHLGHLSEHENHQVEVLAGAFMCVRKTVWDEVKGFDEAFFMYGEDIDLSYRIRQAGYQNYYYPGTVILHFKGESTKKGSLNYVKMFYQAMSIFAKKHLHKGQAALFNVCIQMAIWFRAAIAAVNRLFDYVQMPLVDFFILLASLLLVNHVWEADIRPHQVYNDKLLSPPTLLYMLIMLITLYFSGAYDRLLQESSITKGVMAGTILVIAVNGLLPGPLKYSNGMIVIGGFADFAGLLLIRRLLRYLNLGNFEYSRKIMPNTLILGTREEAAEVRQLLQQAGIRQNLVGTVSPEHHPVSHRDYLGNAGQITKLAEIYKAGEIILCTGRLSFKEIIAYITGLNLPVSYRIHICGSHCIIGGANSRMDHHFYSLTDNFRIATAANRRNKRFLDIAFSGMMLVTFPLHAFFVKKYSIFLRNSWEVLRGRKTWIGYLPGDNPHQTGLPPLRPGVISPLKQLSDNEITPENRHQINLLYAKQYLLWEDILTMIKMYPRLGKDIHS